MYQFAKQLKLLTVSTGRPTYRYVEVNGIVCKVAESTVAIGTTPATAGVAAGENGNGIYQQTTIVLSALAQAIPSATKYQPTLVYTFPEGRIQLLGAMGSMAQTTTSVIASTIASGAVGAWSMGTAACTSTALAPAGAVNILPSTAFAASTVINVPGATTTQVLAAGTVFDGTVTPVTVFFNSAITGTVTADGTETWTGTAKLTWINLGDF